jgi:hypothetical protein
MNDVVGNLVETGIIYNSWALTLNPMSVEIETVNCTLKIPMSIFKRFSEWYLGDQDDLL